MVGDIFRGDPIVLYGFLSLGLGDWGSEFCLSHASLSVCYMYGYVCLCLIVLTSKKRSGLGVLRPVVSDVHEDFSPDCKSSSDLN